MKIETFRRMMVREMTSWTILVEIVILGINLYVEIMGKIIADCQTLFRKVT